jgi:SSS family solute:Na+ symporter
MMVIGLSIIATQVSSITFIGAPGWSYQGGLAAIIMTLNIPIVMWFIVGTFIPFFYNSGVCSRNGKKNRTVTSFKF